MKLITKFNNLQENFSDVLKERDKLKEEIILLKEEIRKLKIAKNNSENTLIDFKYDLENRPHKFLYHIKIIKIESYLRTYKLRRVNSIIK